MVNTSTHLPLKYSWKGHCHYWRILVSMYGGMAWIPFHLSSKKGDIFTFCRNLNLGLTTKARACKGACQEGSPGVTFHAPWSVGECDGMSLTLPSELPLWELESWWIPKFSDNDCRYQNPFDWKLLYIIGKLLERRCLKWVFMTHLGNYNKSYGQKKGLESNWQFDSWPLKVMNRPEFFACRWSATYHWKTLNKSYNFTLDLISIGGMHTKLWAPKVARILILGILGLPFRSPRTKWHLGVSLMAKHKVYYKGEGGGFLEIWAVMNIINMCLPVVRLCTKKVPTMH